MKDVRDLHLQFSRLTEQVARAFADAAGLVEVAQADIPGLCRRILESLAAIGTEHPEISLGCLPLDAFEAARGLFGHPPIKTSLYSDRGGYAIDTFHTHLGPGTVRAQRYPSRPLTDEEYTSLEKTMGVQS